MSEYIKREELLTIKRKLYDETSHSMAKHIDAFRKEIKENIQYKEYIDEMISSIEKKYRFDYHMHDKTLKRISDENKDLLTKVKELNEEVLLLKNKKKWFKFLKKTTKWPVGV